MCLIDFNWYSTLFSFKESVISTQVNFVLKSKKDKGYLHLLPYIFTYTQIFFIIVLICMCVVRSVSPCVCIHFCFLCVLTKHHGIEEKTVSLGRHRGIRQDLTPERRVIDAAHLTHSWFLLVSDISEIRSGHTYTSLISIRATHAVIE